MPLDEGKLIVRMNGAIVQTVALRGPVFTIGRAIPNDLTLPDPTMWISSQHARLDVTPHGVFLSDVSANGTFIDNRTKRLKEPYLLTNGAVFYIGNDKIGVYEITYEAAPQEPFDQPPSTPGETITSPPQPSHLVPTPFNAPQSMNLSPLVGISRYVQDLPVIFQSDEAVSEEDTFLGRFLLIFESIWEPLEQRQDHLAMYFDPRTCPVLFLPWLAHWLDIPLDPEVPEARQRHLLTKAMDIHRQRGTRDGLADVITICTGLQPDIVEIPGKTAFFQVRLPPVSREQRALVKKLIDRYKPAHAGYVLETL